MYGDPKSDQPRCDDSATTWRMTIGRSTRTTNATFVSRSGPPTQCAHTNGRREGIYIVFVYDELIWYSNKLYPYECMANATDNIWSPKIFPRLIWIDYWYLFMVGLHEPTVITIPSCQISVYLFDGGWHVPNVSIFFLLFQAIIISILYFLILF